MLFEALQSNSVQRSGSIIQNNGLLSGFFGGGSSTKNGAVVNNSSALTLSAFYNGITILCNDYAKLPKHVVQKSNNKTVRLVNHPVDYIINQKPNQYMNAFGFDGILMKCAILKGNGYAEKVLNSFTGRVESLQFINENDTPVIVKKFENKLFYHFNGRVLPAENMLHYRSLYSDNGITGVGIVSYAAKSLGVALSSQEFAEEYYASKGIGTGVVTSSKDLDKGAKTRISEALSTSLSDQKSFKIAVIDEAQSFQHIKLSPQESLFLETNKHAIEEVARWLNIPTHKLKSTENTNYSNMESQNISHVSDSILPWAIINEQEYNSKLFTVSERKAGIKVKFNIKSLLQSDSKSQMAWYLGMIYSGAMTRNEVRVLEGLNEIDGLSDPLTAVNLQTLEQLKKSLKLEDNA